MLVARHIHLTTTSLQFSGDVSILSPAGYTLPSGLLSAISIQGDRIMRAKAVAVLTFLLFAVTISQAGSQKVLYTFTGGLDGSQPYQAGVIFDPAGNLYGVTQYGGAYGLGTVFQLTPSPGGAWTETVLHSFTGVPDGKQPQGGLAIDGAGNLYGTTSWGGDPSAGCGTVFELSPSNSGWTFTVLHAFTNGLDGCSPQADLFLSGSFLMGTTAGGGAGSQGTVFSLPISGGSEWVWDLRGTNGEFPGGLGFFPFGTYGTAYFGGAQKVGSVFKLGPGSSIYTKHTFNTTNTAGYWPIGNLAGQSYPTGGFMYGVTSWGGVGGYGTVYQLKECQTCPVADIWNISLLHSFSGLDGDSPWAGVVLDPAGNLYGTTQWGGTDPGYSGTVFKLTRGAKNTWTYKLLYSFTGGTDGSVPTSGVVLDNAGNLYGTTNSGGAFNNGVVYEVVNTTAVVKPTSLTFGPQPLHTTSPAQRISLFNTSSIPITVTSVNLQGEFAVSANKCQNGVKPNTHCDVYVTFTPTGTSTAPRTGAITFVDTAFNSPQSAQLTGTVPYPSKTLVSTSGSPSFVGQAVTFTATVTSTHGTIPDGELVTFYDGTTTLGSVALASGTAAFTTSSLSVREHIIKATYAGDAAFDPSTGSVTQVVEKYPTATTLSSSLNPSIYGQAVTLTATVTSAGPAPTGTVTFKTGSVILGSRTLNTGGVATLATKKIPVGANTVTATYNGNALNGISKSAAITQTVSQASISMVLTSAPNPSAFGASVKFTARLTSNGGLPSGQPATFSYNNVTLGTANVNSYGVATFSTTTLPQGSDAVTAAYAGNVNYSSASATVTQVVH